MQSQEDLIEGQETRDAKRDMLVDVLAKQWNSYSLEKRHEAIRCYSEIAIIIEKLIGKK